MNPVEVEVELQKNEYEYEIKVDGQIRPTGLPLYEGPYSVTPSDEQQILSTTNKAMREDVVVGAVQTQEKDVTPRVTAQTVLPDDGHYLSKVNVGEIPYREVDDGSGNITVYIG